MHERFNFYDIYVYLIPGLTLIGLVWLPYGVLRAAWPEAALASTVALLFVGYVLGHILADVMAMCSPDARAAGLWWAGVSFVLTVASLGVDRWSKTRLLKGWFAAIVLTAYALAIGAWMARHASAPPEQGWIVATGAGLLLVLAYQCHESYSYYANHFAKSVYVAFCSLPDRPMEH